MSPAAAHPPGSSDLGRLDGVARAHGAPLLMTGDPVLRSSGGAQPTDQAALVVEAVGVQKVYGATAALTDANLSVRPGEIHALLGENGAGKSTLVRIMAGLEPADGGRVTVCGDDVGHGPSAGAAFIHQDLGLIGTMSVADNVAFVAGFSRRRGLIDRKATHRAARDVLARLHVEMDVEKTVDELTVADQAIVAIARALSGGARLIVLDEPTAKLHAGEVRALFALLARLRDSGVACVLITHRTEDVLATCDRITVMRDGATVASCRRDEVSQEEIVSMIVGRPHEVFGRPASERRGQTVLELRELTGIGFGPLSFAVAEGELVSLTGLADAGHAAVGEVLFGLEAAASGGIRLGEQAHAPADPAAARAAGIAYLPADRRRDGLAMELTAAENLHLNPPGSPFALVRGAAQLRTAADALQRFGVRPPDPDRVMTTFSGGNQQKVLLARLLMQHPRLLVLNEPTAAVDVGAKAEIYALLRDRCRRDGLSALVITSDFEEAALLCDRAVVLRQGRLAGELEQPAVSDVTAMAYGRAN